MRRTPDATMSTAPSAAAVAGRTRRRHRWWAGPPARCSTSPSPACKPPTTWPSDDAVAVGPRRRPSSRPRPLGRCAGAGKSQRRLPGGPPAPAPGAGGRSDGRSVRRPHGPGNPGGVLPVAARRLSPFLDRLTELLGTCPVTHADETSVRICAGLGWVHIHIGLNPDSPPTTSGTSSMSRW